MNGIVHHTHANAGHAYAHHHREWQRSQALIGTVSATTKGTIYNHNMATV